MVLEAQIGLGGPLGWFGAAADYSLHRFFSLNAGIGLGQSGIQIAGMGRLRAAFGNTAFGFGAGLSGGPYRGGALFANESDARWDTAYWLNTEGFWEWRAPTGFALRAFLGSGAMLNTSSGYYTGAPCVFNGSGTVCGPAKTPVDPKRDTEITVYTGIAMGYAFALLAVFYPDSTTTRPLCVDEQQVRPFPQPTPRNARARHAGAGQQGGRAPSVAGAARPDAPAA